MASKAQSLDMRTNCERYVHFHLIMAVSSDIFTISNTRFKWCIRCWHIIWLFGNFYHGRMSYRPMLLRTWKIINVDGIYSSLSKLCTLLYHIQYVSILIGDGGGGSAAHGHIMVASGCCGAAGHLQEYCLPPIQTKLREFWDKYSWEYISQVNSLFLFSEVKNKTRILVCLVGKWLF